MSLATRFHRQSRPPTISKPSGCPSRANRAFKKNPRMIVGREGHALLHAGRPPHASTACAGLWCCNAGHNREPIVEAIQKQAAELDFSPPFQFGHPQAFQLASRIAALAPGDLDHVFFANSGSEAVDTALKIALAYRNVQRPGRAPAAHRPRARLSRRRLRRHLGRRHRHQPQVRSARALPGVDHLPHTYNRAEQAFSRGEPEWGAHLADELERIVALHDASTIAAVIVEPMAGSTGVLPRAEGLSAAAARRSATSTASCSSSTRSSPASAASATPSRPSATASCPT